MRSIFTISVVTGCLFFNVSCSRQGKAQRLLKSAKTLNERSRSLLVDGRADRAHTAAIKALALTEKAKQIAEAGPMREMALEQMNRAELFSQAVETPAGSIKLWLDATRRGDTELAFAVFDTRHFVQTCFEAQIVQMSPQERQELEQTLLRSLRSTCQKYRDAFSAWEQKEMKTVSESEHAQVDCIFGLLDQEQRVVCHLHKRDGVWRLFDVTDGERGLVQTLKDLSRGFDETFQLVGFFEGKGLLEAYSVLEEAQKVDPLFTNKPWVGHYVRLTAPAELNRDDQRILVEEGRILKVVDYSGGASGDLLVVRTPDADPKASALGKIAIDGAEHLGTDDGQLWGINEISRGTRRSWLSLSLA